MRVVVARRRSAPADGSCPSFSRADRFLPSGAVLALSLILVLGLLLPAWTPGALVNAQTASVGVPTPVVSPTPTVPTSASPSNIDSELQHQMAASPTQLLAVVVEQ